MTTSALPTYVLPMADWPSEETLGERGEYAGFQMYSRQGNDAVAMVVRTVVEAAQYAPLTRGEALHLLHESLERVGNVHPEWQDTEPRAEIEEQISRAFVDVLEFTPMGSSTDLYDRL